MKTAVHVFIAQYFVDNIIIIHVSFIQPLCRGNQEDTSKISLVIELEKYVTCLQVHVEILRFYRNFRA